MQIEEKYKKDYVEALQKLKTERVRFEKELAGIKGIRVIPSQANFIMIELEHTIIQEKFLKILFARHNLLIKELTTKINERNYLQIAIRDSVTNDILIQAMKKELNI